jgi:hypothetical protein
VERTYPLTSAPFRVVIAVAAQRAFVGADVGDGHVPRPIICAGDAEHLDHLPHLLESPRTWR